MPSLSKVGSEMLDGALPALDASSLTSIPAANITGTLPAISGASLTNLDARDLENALPAISGASLTSLPASALSPMFYVYDENVTQSITSGTWTKVNFPDTLFDADDVFDSSTNHRFTVPSGQAGKYVLATRVSVYSNSNNITDARVKIYKNGSFYHGGYLFAYGSSIRHIAPHLNFIEDASAGDYYEVYIAVTATSPQIFADSENKKFQYFYGYKIG